MSDTFHGRSRESLIEEIKENRARLRLVWDAASGPAADILPDVILLMAISEIVAASGKDTDALPWAANLTEQMVARMEAPARGDMN